ncbi:MAG: hypothetical protein HFG00_11895 [Oscillibacter sp.]|nr:hypothetical protein [Oscillibacter sp.]
MNDLEIRRVPFMGAELMAARDNDGQIWAGVRWMCDGIGLSEGQRKRQVANIQTDTILSKGGSNLVLPTNGGLQEVLCLKLDFVPLWLAKISITPTMERETPELAERLEQYQLHAKDVLAAAFLPSFYGAEETALTPQRVLTPDDYLRAASIVANCRNERLPYVLGFLEQGGFEITEVENTKHPDYELAYLINKAINEYGFSCVQIGQLTGISRGQIHCYRNGRIPHGSRAKYIIHVLTDAIAKLETKSALPSAANT